LTDKEVGKSSVYWVLTMMYRREQHDFKQAANQYCLVWRGSEPNAVTTVVAPGATELHLVQLLSQLRQLNSGELELTQLSSNTSYNRPPKLRTFFRPFVTPLFF